MVDLHTLRHSRHALLNGFDDEGVHRVSQARAVVIGAGGLGCPAVTYLVSSGLGQVAWIDGDTVDATNLARQTLFGPDDIGISKVLAGARALHRLHPEARISTTPAYADEALLEQSIPGASVVLDCTDQWAIRQLINAVCVRHQVPLVSAAAIEWSGQLLTMDLRRSDQACYACVFDPESQPDAHACGAYGVLAPMVGAMGCLQAA
ncbi:MAG: HesA/MoeB/ThiF family protein, partial [Burkholderiaceae bacterium]